MDKTGKLSSQDRAVNALPFVSLIVLLVAGLALIYL